MARYPLAIDARTVPAGDPPARDLLAATVAELEGMYGPLDAPGMTSATATELSGPHSAYVVLFEDGTPSRAAASSASTRSCPEIKRKFARRRILGAEGALDDRRDRAREVGRDDVGRRHARAE